MLTLIIFSYLLFTSFSDINQLILIPVHLIGLIFFSAIENGMTQSKKNRVKKNIFKDEKLQKNISLSELEKF